jgi:shikimate kinase
MSSLSIDGRPLFLIGIMGSGKSTVGRILAARLGREFVDLDEQVEHTAQSTVAEIFAAEGEAGFRARERTELRRVCGEGPQVVAVGGGAPASGDNLDRMLEAGVVVCLTAAASELESRLGDCTTRPLLAGAGDRRSELARLLGQRAAFYARAHLTIATTALPPSKVATAVLAALGVGS